MGQGQINSFQANRSSPMEGILAALQAVHTYYGIDTARQQAELAAKQRDPNSQESKLAQQEANSALDFMAKHHLADEKSLAGQRDIILGSPVGPLNEGEQRQPGLSAAALAQNPEMSPLLALAKGQQAADAMGSKFNSINDTKKSMQENSIHAQVLSKLDTNKALQGRLNQYQNLDNAYSNLLGTGPVTAQKIQDFQQGIIKNLGISGTSGVGERGERYYNSLDLKAGAGLQFLTGNPVDLANSKFLPGLIEQAKTEQQNIAAQMNKQVSALTSGHQSMYARRPDLKSDLDQAVASHISQFASSSNGLGGTGGSGAAEMGGGSPFPGASAQAGSIDPGTQQFSKTHGIDPVDAQFIIDQRRMRGNQSGSANGPGRQ